MEDTLVQAAREALDALRAVDEEGETEFRATVWNAIDTLEQALESYKEAE